MKKICFLLTLGLAVLLTEFAHAQATVGQTVKEWERSEAYTKEYLDVMPENGYGLKPTPQMRSFAEHAYH
jgi:hypothetical protein